MSNLYSFVPSGVCSRKIEFSVEDNIIKSLNFVGGCHGNTQGIAKLAVGMNIYDVIEKLENINCGFKGTSCPDQLARALKQYLKEIG